MGTYRSVERIFLALTAVFLAYIAAALLASAAILSPALALYVRVLRRREDAS